MRTGKLACCSLLLALLALLLACGEVVAQGVIIPGGGYGNFYSVGGAARFRRGNRLSVGMGFFGTRFSTGGGFGLGGFCDPFIGPPVVGRVTSLTIVSTPPPVVFVTPPPFPFLDPLRAVPPDDILPVPGPDEIAPPPPPPPALQAPAPQPRPVLPPLPKKEDPPPRKENPPPPPPPPAAKKRAEGDDLPFPRLPADDPRDEHARQLSLGREAFLWQEYGRAAQRFREAIRLQPKQAQPYLLLGQALIAQGKYHEAYDALIAGLQKAPPNGRANNDDSFQPLELYGGEGLVEYAEQLERIEQVIARHRRDPVLAFVYGYLLWFDGRKQEAAQYLRTAEAIAPREVIEAFLRGLPGVGGF